MKNKIKVRDWSARIPARVARAVKMSVKRWAIRTLRLALDRADEWLHAREVALRESIQEREAPGKGRSRGEFDRRSSAARERGGRAARPGIPRLKYEHGQFVRREA